MNWKEEARDFFSHRAKVVGNRPMLKDLCFVSGRDPRVWADQARYDDMIDSVVRSINADGRSQVLEVGCAAGFVACGVAPRVGQYVGVDVAEGAIECARSLDLPNATFEVGDGGQLPFEADRFDGIYCYDVLTNFPSFDSVTDLIGDMFRTVRPGGKILLGSIPDAAKEQEFLEAVARMQTELARQAETSAPAPAAPVVIPSEPGFWAKCKAMLGLSIAKADQPVAAKPVNSVEQLPADQGSITCFYFYKQDFESFAGKLGATCVIEEVHIRHPFYGYRYNVVLTKSA
ncbi:class I SAM-dependent methyltransferase [Achromobacter xylosoxidans]|uniref:class I SAM-dependent methyltransferase n=1 Tax=Alcaligenes xylosoxydans xylosoxydans TaxID=85698 RepID=UPI0009B9D392|nr:class I SAM-dependent methyltransferase [Achromobacter xylosoxidans]